MGGPPVTPEIDRFTPKYRVDANGCWVWTASKIHTGYGRFFVGSRTDGTNRTVMAHRWSYEYFVGPIPDGLNLDHLCRNRACVNPEHLEPVTPKENIHRGVGEAAKNRKKATCKRGHPLSGENVRLTADGRRQCRTCTRIRGRRQNQTESRKAWNREWQRSEQRKAYKRAYDAANRERHNAYMREYRRKKRAEA